MPKKQKPVRIVVCQRGWVVVGEYSQTKDEATVERASVIRVWGTTQGLGQIAAGGPTSTTKLDPCGTVRLPVLAIVLTMDANQAKWNASLR